MTNFIIALVAALILIGVGFALHARIKAEAKKLEAYIYTEFDVVHERLNAIAKAVIPETKAQAATTAPPQKADKEA